MLIELIVIIVWFSIGFLSYILMTYLSWNRGDDITFSMILMSIPTTLLGVVSLLILAENHDFTIIKGKR
jgi:hypothetical protein